MLWGVFGIMLIAASLAVAWPVYRSQSRLSLMSAALVVVVIGLSAGLYSYIGTPDFDAIEPGPSSVEDMVQSLDARLQEYPDDVAGWKMLGRSYAQLGNAPKAIAAFEKAVALEDSRNGDTLISLGEVIFVNDESSIGGRAGQLFESGLALEPSNPRALFFAGLAAAHRGNNEIAADRWEALLALSPPPQIEDVLRQRIAQWRGLPVMVDEVLPKPAANSAVVSINIEVGEDAAGAINPASSVFVIARDPARPSPPLAVARRTAGELPTVVPIGDADAMIPGRVPSAYESLEIIVRVSASGQPIAQSGDWYGQSLVRPAEGDTVSIVVDRQVP